ncbi:hypothetical protein CSA56_16595 [candidate division KSB3 bacterium]|uniref:DUF1468 domain-containing protein n=1 Tax=candidate division KSB3 bacterium TaxID=2044937 RepID=A0A2G6KAS2_9BACT|nr:MAG: hypothetical protein CSA56_16595 [candidate division KSB3 bacterium]
MKNACLASFYCSVYSDNLVIPVMKEHNMPKADFVTSIVLVLFGIAVFILSVKMPKMEELGADPYSAPGIVPGFLGGIIAFLGVVLFWRSLRQGGARLELSGEKWAAFFRDNAYRRVLLTSLLGVIYGIGLLGRVPYVLATFVYVLVFVVLFEYRQDISLHDQKKMLFWACIQAVFVSGIIAGVFRYLFLVDLP